LEEEPVVGTFYCFASFLSLISADQHWVMLSRTCNTAAIPCETTIGYAAQQLL